MDDIDKLLYGLKVTNENVMTVAKKIDDMTSTLDKVLQILVEFEE